MTGPHRSGLAGLTMSLVLGIASLPAGARDGPVWMHDSGDWGAWAAFAVPHTDFFIFSIGCIDGPDGVTLHVELPVFGLREGEPAWIELRRGDLAVRYDGTVFFNEMMSEHQVIGYAPRADETFDTLAAFLNGSGTFVATIPGGSETVPVDDTAMDALSVVRHACLYP